MKSQLYALAFGAAALYVGQNASNWGIMPNWQDWQNWNTPVAEKTAVVQDTAARDGLYCVASEHHSSDSWIVAGPPHLKEGDRIFIGRAWPWQSYTFIAECDVKKGERIYMDETNYKYLMGQGRENSELRRKLHTLEQADLCPQCQEALKYQETLKTK